MNEVNAGDSDNCTPLSFVFHGPKRHILEQNRTAITYHQMFQFVHKDVREDTLGHLKPVFVASSDTFIQGRIHDIFLGILQRVKVNRALKGLR